MISVVTLSVQCYDTSAKLADTSMISAVTLSVQCYDTPASATTLLLVLRHFCYVGKHVSVCASAPLFNTTSYLQVPIVLCPSNSLFSIYTDKHLYDKNMNNVIYGNNYTKSQVTSSVL